MSTAADTSRRPDAAPEPLTRPLALTAAQVSVIVALAWLWSTPAADSSSTTIDWTSVVLTAGTPVVLALSGWISSRARDRRPPARSRALRAASATTHGITHVLLVVALVVAPLSIFGELVFGPMG